MNKKLKRRISIFIFCISFVIFTISTPKIQKETISGDMGKIKTADSWKLIQPIHINDLDISRNWSYTASNYEWCTGSGTWIDPYIIQNVYLDGANATNCILIENSNVYFEINNCTLINAGVGTLGNEYAGLKLERAYNGYIYNCTCSYNNEIGINLVQSSNNTIFDCNANHNQVDGISLNWDSGVPSNNNTIEFCTFNFNEYNGIEIYNSDNTYVASNVLLNNTREGIKTYGYTYNTSIIGNIIAYSGSNGIDIGNTAENNIWGNEILSSQGDGLRLFSCNNSAITLNTFTNNVWGISIDGQYNNITDNIIEGGLWGMHCSDANYSYIYNNIIDGVKYIGMFLSNVLNSNISTNTIIYSEQGGGMSVMECYNLSIANNIINYNEDGIELTFSEHIDILDNIISHNDGEGIFLDASNYSRIISNSINYNNIGISLSNCYQANVSYNSLYCNGKCIETYLCVDCFIEFNSCVACPTPGIAGYNLFILIGLIALVSLITLKRSKIKE